MNNPRAKDEWRTPPELFTLLNAHYHFTLDAAATRENRCCKKYCSRAKNGLAADWAGERVFMHPPYSNLGPWLLKALQETRFAATRFAASPSFTSAVAREAARRATLVVALIPADPSTGYWHELVHESASKIILLRGRVHFLNAGGEKQGAPRFASAVVVYGPSRGRQLYHTLDVRKMQRGKALENEEVI
jgi:site-specific DNA-methyltransferase (adenine-specific)